MTKTKRIELKEEYRTGSSICPECGTIYSRNPDPKKRNRYCGECYMKDRLKMKAMLK